MLTPSRAVVSLYQRLALPPSGLEEAQGPWYHAIQRCLDACDSITNVLRGMHDTNLENISPLIISCIFVASRFFLGTHPVFSLLSVIASAERLHQFK
jgi:hypothetical protein